MAAPHRGYERCTQIAEIPSGSKVTPPGWVAIGAGTEPGELMCGACAEADPTGGSLITHVYVDCVTARSRLT
jgi:hypothetical protein